MAGLYIHVPFCRHKCSYCDFVSYPDKIAYAEAYMACLFKEIELRGEQLKDKDYAFDTVYFGGGTPSVIDPKYIYGAMKQILKSFRLSKNPEITIEMNPGTVSESKIATYKRAGINRFSIGLQSAVDSQLEDVCRIHKAHDYVYCAKLLSGENFSADVMIGLKNQSIEDIKKTIELAYRCGTSHISMYALTPEEGTPIYTDYLNGELPSSDEVADMYKAGTKYLKSLGFERYEVSNFSKPGKESRHNLNYWKRGEYLGFGVSASSFMFDHRFTNTFDLDEYMKCILSGCLPVVENEEVSGEDAKFEFVMLAMRTKYGVNAKEFKEKFGEDFFEKYKSALGKNAAVLQIIGDTVRIKDEYLYVQNTILMDFMQNNI